jgi:subtilisin family serine protease
MRRFRWVLAILLLVAGLDDAEAAKRHFLSANTLGQSLNASPAAATAFRQLQVKAGTDGTVRVIVGLRVPYAAEGQLDLAESRTQRADIAAAGNRLANALPGVAGQSVRSLGNLPFVAMNVTRQDLSQLASDPNVLSVTEDRLNRPFLAQSVPLIRGDAAWAAGYRGLGQTIAIIDTGVDATHPFLFGKVVSEACFSSGGWCPGGATVSLGPGAARPCPVAECAHGTHVAGIAAGNGPEFSGVAKDASIIAIQVFSPDKKAASAWDSDIILGLNRVYELRTTYRIAAVNMSLGRDSELANCQPGASDPMLMAIANLRQAGIATVISSGNDYKTDRISYPACLSGAVSVGAVWDAAYPPAKELCGFEVTAADKVACFSNSASILSLLAPGAVITSSVPNRQYAAYSGTSMAAPHVAGAFAILKEKAPASGVAQILAALQETGLPVKDYRNDITKPRIDVMAALDKFTDPRKELVYVRAGSASGTVNFSPAGTVATCKDSCSNRFPAGTTVNMTASPNPGAMFFGWSGACMGTGTCTVTMSQARTVSAGFFTGIALNLTYAKAGGGNGSVDFSASGFTANCAANCTQSYWRNAMVRLTAMPATGSTFMGWSGACRGKKISCIVRLSRVKSVTATFEITPRYTLTYTQQGSGGGEIQFNDGTVACSKSCTRTFLAGSRVTFSVHPDALSKFAGWGGACRGGKSSCIVTVHGPMALSAAFRPAAAATASR